MKVNQLKRFLLTCTPNTDVGITLVTKQGLQFTVIDGNDMSIFKSPDGTKCLSLFNARKNEPFPEGAIIQGVNMYFDDIPTSPEEILNELKARFDITPMTNGKKPEELTDDELTEILFRCVHQEIGNLIRLNNNLLVYVKNKYKMQRKFWIDVKEKERNEKEGEERK